MDYPIMLVSFGSLVVSIIVSWPLTSWIIERLNRRGGQKTHPFVTPAGGAFLFAVIFVAVWCVVSFLLALPLFWVSRP